MNPVRKLLDDLVQKRLWPVAVALVVAAIAVPAIIAGSGGDGASDASDPALALAPGADAPAPPALELAAPPAVRTRAGAVRDPFRRSASAVVPTPGTAVPTAKSAKPSAGVSSSKTATKAKPATVKPKAKPKPKPAIDPAIAIAARSSYQTVVRFTRASGTRERPLARLAVLGNSSNPALQYLGVSSDGDHAIFVLGSKATSAGGDGVCVVDDPCRAIGLREGDKLGVDVADGLVIRHYELEVTALRRLHMQSAARARAWRARVDADGYGVRQMLAQDPATAGVLGKLRFSTRTGTLALTP